MIMTADDDCVIAFDTAVLTVAPRALGASGLSVQDAPVEPESLTMLLLHDAWGFDSIPKLVEHLQQYETVTEQLSITSVPSESWFYNRRKTLVDATLSKTITEASQRAVHAVWRNGYEIPASVERHWGLDNATAVTEYPVSDLVRQEAIRKWVQELLAEAAGTLTFNRGRNTEYDLDQFIGALAHSALTCTGLTATSTTASWIYDATTIPGGSGLLKCIKSLDIEEIEAQFRAAQEQVLQRCAQRGLFDDPIDIAFDTTEITSWTSGIDATVGQRNRAEDATPDWMFLLLTSINRDARVCFGVKLLRQKSAVDTHLESLIQVATEQTQVRYGFADKEFYNSKVIDVLRRYIGDGWVIKARKQKPIKDFIRMIPQGEPGFGRNINATSATPNPNAFAVPDRLHGQQQLQFFQETGEVGSAYTHTAYLTDLNDEQATPDQIKFRYDDRWSIETGMSQYKHDFLPMCESSDPKVRLYCANIAVLFFNWHALINRALTPQYNLPVNVTSNELLTAIRDVAFSSPDKKES